MTGYIIGALGIVLLIIFGANVVIVPQAYSYVIERLGAFKVSWGTGLHIKTPFIEKVAKRVDLKEQVYDFAPQPVITKDNVTIMVDTIVFFSIFDAKLYTYGVMNPIMAIENLCATTLRNIVGDLELDQTLTSRDIINSKMRSIVDEATDPWGIKVTRVELKSITPPQAIKDSMEKQMKAEREKREAILVAEGKRQAAILEAEGEKESAILRADAVREKMIREAEGEAQAIVAVQKATAEGIKLIKEAGADEAVIRLESLKAFKEAANGKANKIIIPSDIQGMAGIVASLGELARSSDSSKAETSMTPRVPVKPTTVTQTDEPTTTAKQSVVQPTDEK